MKILALSKEINRWHGWGRYSFELVQNFRSRNVPMSVFTHRTARNDLLVADIAHPILSSVTESGWRVFFAAFEALRLLPLASKSTIIHALDETAVPLAYYLSRWSKRPFVVTLHGTYCIEAVTGSKRRQFKKMFRAASGLIAVSDYTRRRFLEHMPEIESRVKVIPLGVSPELIDQEIRGIEARKPILLNVGAVKKRKGVLHAVRALGALRDVVPSARLVVVGGFDKRDPYVVEVLQESERLGLAARVILLGEVDEATLSSLYRESRALVMPSQNAGTHFEGFGLVHLEAAAKGLPTIGSLNCGNEEVIVDGYTGFLVGQSDQETLSYRMKQLLVDDGLWRRFSIAAIERAKAMSWGKAADETYCFLQTFSRS